MSTSFQIWNKTHEPNKEEEREESLNPQLPFTAELQKKTMLAPRF